MFRTFATFLFVLLVVVVLYLLAWPVPIEPVSWQAPADPGLTGVCETNDRLYLTRLFGHQLPYVEESALVRQ